MRLLSPLAAAAIASLAGAGLAYADPLPLAVSKAEVAADSTGAPALSLVLTPDSSKAFAVFTTANTGRIVDFSIDGKVMMSPRVVEPILGGQIMVSGQFGLGELARIAGRIVSGEARVTVDVAAQ